MVTTCSNALDSMHTQLTTSSVGTGRLGVKWSRSQIRALDKKNLLFERKKNGEISNVIEEVSRQLNLEVDSVFVQELLDFHNQELTMDELTEMHEQGQNIEEFRVFRPSSIRR
ncbi:hypothetical protein TNCV_4394461 [Trichonephila clavipes]|uniref:Uncharacterized protein n=1 Tax=Trichonephila clavipes TaxID=2585209 RepID=A0A8X7BF45_TRICX|nr:hypothetical protein TNCV_4394461 [Trichonephila clavipes]